MTLSVELAGMRTVVRGRPHTESGPRMHLGVSMQTIAEVLVRARAEIPTADRWCQGAAAITWDRIEMRDPTDQFIYPARDIVARCSEGAITWAAFWIVSPSAHPTVQQVTHAAIDLFEKACGCGIAAWNDAPGRSHEEAVAMFDRAIHMALVAR